MLCRRKKETVLLCIICIGLYAAYSAVTLGNSKEMFFIQTQQRQSNKVNSDSTGQEFKGDIVRHFTGERMVYLENGMKRDTKFNECENWGVMTTIFSPSEAVRRFLYLHQWCLVIVGDLKSPQEYKIISSQVRERQVIYLNPKEQDKFSDSFSKALPWNSFGRKNIGYLYAMKNGAKVIWDFDDDNYIKFWMDGAAPDSNVFLDSHISLSRAKNVTASVVSCDSNTLFFNPYPYLGATAENAWPRGFPISNVNLIPSSKCNFQTQNIISDKIGILQSLADHQPDVDAIFRMTKQDKFYFDYLKVKTIPKNSFYMLLSNGLYTPTNAQATFYFEKAFKLLYLPVTVPGRVSDIWRSYIGQGILSLYGIYTGFFRRALVDQNRNKHLLEADFQSEIDLYTKTKSLVTLIDKWTNMHSANFTKKKAPMEEHIIDLYIYLYERNFLELEDVRNIQVWLQALEINTGKSTAVQVGKPLLHNSYNIKSNRCRTDDTNVLTFWTSDLHDGCRLDIPSTLNYLGYNTIIAGIKKNQTPYPEAFTKKKINVYSGPLPEAVMSYKTHSTALTEVMISNSIKFFQSSSLFRQVDAVTCSFPASMCQLWFPFNKTKSIVFLPAHRYNLGRCTFESWNLLNKQLNELENDRFESNNEKHTIGAVSRYDLEYLKYYTGLKNALLVPSFSGFYTDVYSYNPEHEEILLVSNGIPSFIQSIKTVNIVHYREKYKHYSLSEIASHPAIIFIPYSVMSFKFTEFYSLSIPLFVPSPKLMFENGGLGPDRTSTSPPYCKEYVNMPKHSDSYHQYNPNVDFNDSPENEMYWLQFSDFYDLPHIIYFDNGTDLDNKIQKTDFKYVHKYMLMENAIRKTNVIQTWCKILNRIRHTV